MDDEKNQVIETPEEAKADEEVLNGTLSTDEQIAKEIAEESGLDLDTDADIIAKLVDREKARQKAHHDKLSGAIKQKRKWRDLAKGSKETPENGAGKSQIKGQEEPKETIDQAFNRMMDERDLRELDLEDELKEETKKVAKLNGISIKKAAQDPYILYKKGEMDKAKKIEEGTPKRKPGGSYSKSNFDPSKPLNPADYDLSTKEGREQWDKDKAVKHQYEREQHKK